MPFPIALLAAQLGQAGLQIYSGIKKENEANRTVVPNNPVLETPESEILATEILANRSTFGFSPQLLENFNKFQQQSLASSLNAGVTSGNINANNIIALNNSNQASLLQLAKEDEAQRSKNVDSYLDQLARLTELEFQKFEFNEVNPFIAAKRKKETLLNEGRNEILGGVSTGITGLANSFLANAFKTPTPGEIADNNRLPTVNQLPELGSSSVSPAGQIQPIDSFNPGFVDPTNFDSNLNNAINAQNTDLSTSDGLLAATFAQNGTGLPLLFG